MALYKAKVNEALFQIILTVFLTLLAVVTLYPFLNIVAKSLSTGTAMVGRKIGLIPVKFTLDNYRSIFVNNVLINSFMISVAKTVTGSILTLAVTGMAAYAVAHKSLKGRKIFIIYVIITMYFSGGLIPTYMLIRNLGLMNNFLVYIIPSLFKMTYFLIMYTYFKTLPESFEESAKMDGASYTLILIRIVIPLSAPVIATITLFSAVGQWNAWFDAILYVTRIKLYSLQPLLRTILIETQAEQFFDEARYGMTEERTYTLESIRMAVIVFTIAPIAMVYPFLQKYFVKGIMIGGLKG